MDQVIGSGAVLFIMLFALLLGILWILLPFAIFGMKKRQAETNELLELINATLAEQTVQTAKLVEIHETQAKLQAISLKARAASANSP